MSLETFFATMKPFLLGHLPAGEAEAVLGPSPSGTTSFDFYRVLIDRNMFKVLRELYRSLPPVVERHRPGLWAEMVRTFIGEHPPRHADPNRNGEGFVEWLQARREADETQPTLFEELADFHWIKYQALIAPEPEDDGFDRTLFVRMYRNPIPKVSDAILRDNDAELPAEQPTLVVVYRHRRNADIRVFYPSPASWAVLANRQGLPLPPALAEIDPAIVADAERGLIAEGILPEPRGDAT